MLLVCRRAPGHLSWDRARRVFFVGPYIVAGGEQPQVRLVASSAVGGSGRQTMTVSPWAQASLLQLASVLFAVALAWRVVDIFVLRLGDTWLNILPSKLFPLLVLIVVFWSRQRGEVRTVLGLSKDHLRTHIVMGLVLGVSIWLVADVASAAVYAGVFDPQYPLAVYVVTTYLLPYSALFFLTNALLEEALFRGLIQNALATRVTMGRAVLGSAILFGLWHLTWPLLSDVGRLLTVAEALGMVVLSALLGVFMGLYYARFARGRSLMGPVMMHTLFNFLNENFKVGEDPSVVGPDFVFSNATLMVITVLMFIASMGVLMVLVAHYHVEDMSVLTNRLRARTSCGATRGPSPHTEGPGREDGHVRGPFIAGTTTPSSGPPRNAHYTHCGVVGTQEE